jgi:ketosteroid isomerase-like protein
MAPGDDPVRLMLERWARGDYEPRSSEVHPDLVIVSYLSGPIFRGPGGIRRWVGGMKRAFDDWSFELEELIEAPNARRLAIGRLHLVGGKRTGEDVHRRQAFLFTLDDGLIVRIEGFPNRLDEAYAAAGLDRQTPA